MNTFEDATSWRNIGDGIYMKDVRSWTKNDYAGEGLFQESETNSDKSGCLKRVGNQLFCDKPKASIVRMYKKGNMAITSSLRYPQLLGGNEGYLWELGTGGLRFKTEIEMENHVRKIFSDKENQDVGKLVKNLEVGE